MPFLKPTTRATFRGVQNLIILNSLNTIKREALLLSASALTKKPKKMPVNKKKLVVIILFFIGTTKINK